jgi:hypothetical protein
MAAPLISGFGLLQMRKLTLKHIGQIKKAEIEFGDLTVLVGPQATGKSIFLQFFKLLIDSGHILAELKKHGLDWKKERSPFLDIYFGEGMRGLWRGQSEILVDDFSHAFNKLIERQKRDKDEKLFFIPAQRVITLGKGWPRPFTDYSPGDPFVVRQFSDHLRVLMEKGFGETDKLFPHTRRLKTEIRDLLQETVFSSFELEIDREHGPQKRLILRTQGQEQALPFMVWSAGQREFVPLLLGLFWLLPGAAATRREPIEWVVIEELEMGLHPKAVSAALLLVLDLLARGYRVCLSTHSTHVLDVVWAMKTIQDQRAPAVKLLDIFDAQPTQQMRSMIERTATKSAKVYYFDPKTKETKGISNLDPGASSEGESGWGGLSEFSGRVAEVVAGVVNDAGEHERP